MIRILVLRILYQSLLLSETYILSEPGKLWMISSLGHQVMSQTPLLTPFAGIGSRAQGDGVFGCWGPGPLAGGLASSFHLPPLLP